MGENLRKIAMHITNAVSYTHLNDNVDSANGGMDNDFTPLRNLFNEGLVRDTSKKIKAVKRATGMRDVYKRQEHYLRGL